MTRRIIAVAVLTAVGVLPLASASAAPRKIPALYKNCTSLNKKYPHGIGRAHAHDKTTGKPVTAFARSDHLYRLAMSYNKGLDRDKDGVACEKA